MVGGEDLLFELGAEIFMSRGRRMKSRKLEFFGGKNEPNC